MNAVIVNGGNGNERGAACRRIKDAAEEYLRALVASDATVWVTPVTFGAYSSTFKKALDRQIPVLFPFFVKTRGEVHHPQRYKKRRKLLAIGTMPKADSEAERIFQGLVQRNAMNLNPLKTDTCVIYENTDDAEMATRVKELIQAAEIA
jgi:multimeric flavodoxin WrbA